MATPENVRRDNPADSLRRAISAQREASEIARKAADEAQSERESEPSEESEENE